VLDASLLSLGVHATVAALAVEGGASSGGARRVALAAPARISLPALLGELLSSEVSSWARSKLGTYACLAPEPHLPPPPPPPGVFAWNSSALLSLLDAALQKAGPVGLDGLVRLLTGGSGEVVVPAGTLPALRHNVSGLGQLDISVGELNASGLDSLAALQLLKPVPADSAALSSALALGSLNVSLDLHVAIEGARGARSSSALRVSLALRDVELEAAARLALDLVGLKGLQLRQLSLNCTARQLLGGVLLSVGARATVDVLALDGAAAWGAPGRVALPRPARLVLPRIVSDLASQAVTRWAAAQLASLHGRECAPARHPPPTIVDVRSSPLIAHIEHVLDDVLGGSGDLSLNHLVDKLSALLGMPNGELHLNRKFFDVYLTDARVGQVGVQLSDLRLRGLDAGFGMALFEPTPSDPRLLTHSSGVGGYVPLRAEVHLRLLLGSSWHDLDLKLALRNISLDLATPLALDRYALGSVSLAQLLRHPGCLVASLVNLSLVPAVSRLAVHAPRAGGVEMAVVRTDHTGSARLPALLPLLAPLAPGLSQMAADALGGALGRMHAGCAGVPYAPPPQQQQPTTNNWANVLIALLILIVPAVLAVLTATLAVRKARRRRRRAKALGLTAMPLSAAKLAWQQDAAAATAAAAAKHAAAAATHAATHAATPATAAGAGTSDGLTCHLAH
jgi:hypothetical protein